MQMGKISWVLKTLIVIFLFDGCKPKETNTPTPTVSDKTTLGDNTIILSQTGQNSIVEIRDSEIILRDLPNGRVAAGNQIASVGAGTNLIITPNSKYPDGVARYIQEVNKNSNGTYTAKTSYPQLDNVFKVLNEKNTAIIGPSTISKIYKPNGDELPYKINGSLGIVPISFSFPINGNDGVKIGDLSIEGSIEFNGTYDFAVVINENTKYWISKATIQDKEKLTATFTTGTKSKKITIDKEKGINLDGVKFKPKPFEATIPIFETKLTPITLGPAFWITPRVKFYVKIIGDAQGQISLTIIDRDGGTTVRYDEITQTQGWKTEIEKVSPGSTQILSNLELGLAGSLAITPTLEISGSPWGYKDAVEIGVTLGLESKLGIDLSAGVKDSEVKLTLSGKGATKIGGKVKINAIWRSIVDYEPAIKIGSEWDIFRPLEFIYTIDIPSNTIPTNGLVAYYPFNGNANDESGNKNNGVVNQGVALTTDRKSNKDKAYNFGGVDKTGYIKVANSAVMTLNKTLSVSLWYKLNSYYGMDGNGKSNQNGYHVMIGKEGDRDGFYMGVGNDATTKKQNVNFNNNIGFNSNFSIVGNPSGTNLENLNKWIHAVTVIDGTNAKLYINGTLVKTTTVSPNFSSSNSKNLYVGTMWALSDSWYPFNGSIDDIRIYNRSLSDTEILALSKE